MNCCATRTHIVRLRGSIALIEALDWEFVTAPLRPTAQLQLLEDKPWNTVSIHVHFTHDNIACDFKDGKSFDSLIQELHNGNVDPLTFWGNGRIDLVINDKQVMKKGS